MWMIATDVLKSSLNHQVPEKSRMVHLNLIRQYICVTTMWHPATFIRHKWRLYFYQINLYVRVYVHSSVLICFRYVLSFVTFAPCLFSMEVCLCIWFTLFFIIAAADSLRFAMLAHFTEYDIVKQPQQQIRVYFILNAYQWTARSPTRCDEFRFVLHTNIT